MSSSSRAVTALLDGDWRASLGDLVLFEEIWKWGFGFGGFWRWCPELELLSAGAHAFCRHRELLDSRLKQGQKEFEEKFQKSFCLTNKVDSQSMNVGRAVMANLVGGIGYFYGQSKIALARSSSHNKCDNFVPYWLLSFIQMFQADLFSRGFLWDEGVGIFIFAWTLLDTLVGFDECDGWIPREQILGAEALRVLKWTFLYYLSFKAFHISWLPKLCSVQGSAISSNLKALFPAWYFAFTYFTADCIGILTDQNKLVVAVGGATALAAGVYTTRNICMNQKRNQRWKSLFPSLIPLLIRNGIRDGNKNSVSDSVANQKRNQRRNS
ncbi:hypothetical protein Syun_027583 [Stephania yunnanensis]|uniref:Uncharacterized protein n=1 Tax=Stephania yunnanensis TaxID=152371 RepID=A0AAP0EKY9_9MAGN